MEPQHLAIMLLILGLALLVAEFFIPSGGMITVMAVVSLVGSVWFAWRAWGGSNSTAWWTFVGILVLLLPTTLGGTLYALQKTRLGSRILLDAPSLKEVTPYAHEQERLQRLVGTRGRTVTMLNPGGLVLVAGERLHSETPGMLLDPDTDVEVIAVRGTRIVVRPVTEQDDESRGPSDQRTAGRESLDFDLPPS